MKTASFLRAFVRSSAIAFLVFVSTSLQAADSETGAEYFERHVRPLLAEKCFSCHGRGQRKGSLSLDHHDSLMAGGESGVAVVQGKPEESLLVEAIEYSGSLQMPPDNKLSDREIQVLRKWIALGLPWPDETSSKSTLRNAGSITEQDRQFWSFRPIQNPELPSVRRTDWPRRPLDRFVLNRLEAEGLEPTTEADRRTYIRRLSLDLIGIPPTESEITAFVNDPSIDAYETLVERLLDMPQYGERWARHWLDIARYGEDQAHTFQARRYPSGYRYRDWVIDSFNRDLPIDQFLMQQIAGDLLPGEDQKQRLSALGYFALGPVYYADAGCAPKAKADEYDDRIDTLTRGILGLTVSCARCHDHKFDPISVRDYYALAGIFSSTEYAEKPLVPPEVVKAYEEGQAAIKQAEQRLKDCETEASRDVAESLAPRTTEYLLAAWRVQNRRKNDANYPIKAAIQGTDLHDVVVDRWLQALSSDLLRGNSAFKDWFEIGVAKTKIDLAGHSEFDETVQRVAREIQTRLENAIQTRREAEQALRRERANASEDVLASNKKKVDEAKKLSLPDAVSKLLNILVDNVNAPFALPKDRIDHFLSEETKQRLATLRMGVDEKKKSAPAKYDLVHTLTEGKPNNQKIQLRGNVSELGDEVPRRFLEILSTSDAAPFEQGSGRLELAKAIVSPNNPLTARVFVNRVWQHHFGRGIVSTPSNFGLLGVPPTHPELLDYLASKFVASGWSLKQLHREIVLSATYRLASASNPVNAERDPDNRWLWRMNRRRLDIESWRDSILLVCGNLDLSLGGPSFNLADKNNRRRTLYAAVSRHELNPVLRLFDFPDPNLTSERRSLTTVPMQQLFVLNSEFMIDQSRALASRLEKSGLMDHASRVEQLYRWVFGRIPTAKERKLGINFLDHGTTAGAVPSDVKLSRVEQYCQALLSTNEFFFVD
jgi:cytochrome c553